MKRNYLYFVYVFFTAVVLVSCGNKVIPNSLPNEYVGKWDMTNDKESSVQKTIEIKEGNVFVETWTVYDDDGNLYGEVEIHGKCELEGTEEGYQKDHALCLVYDLESLSDPEGILETFEMEDFFKDENDRYEAAKEKGQVYGLQDIRISGSALKRDYILHFKGGEWKLIDETKDKSSEESN